MQIKGLHYMNQGYSKRQALLKAGYSLEVAEHPTKQFMEKGGVKKMIETMGNELVDAGLTTAYMVNKFTQWMEAQKVVTSPTEEDKYVPDYAIQMKAYQEWKKIMDADRALHNPGGEQVKKRLTIEEFVTNKEEILNGSVDDE